PARNSVECRANVGEFAHLLADAGEIGAGFDAAGRVQIERARLVPVDAVGRNDVVEGPKLVDPAPRARHGRVHSESGVQAWSSPIYPIILPPASRLAHCSKIGRLYLIRNAIVLDGACQSAAPE